MAALTNRWSLDSAHVSGTALSADVGSVTGTLASTTAVTADAGGGLHFDGSSSAQIALSACPLPASMAAHSVVFRYNNDDLTQFNTSSATPLALVQSTGDTVRVICDNVISGINLNVAIWVGGVEITCPVAVNVVTGSGAEHIFAYTWDGASTVLLYVDGVLQTGVSDNRANFSQPTINAISGKSATAGFIKGAVRDVRIYDGALTATEVANVYTSAAVFADGSDQKFWSNGLPLAPLSSAADPSGQKYWHNGLPMAGLFVASSTSTTTLAPTVGAVTVTGQTPTIGRGLSPAVGAIALSGQSPALTTALAPATGAISISGQAVTVSQGTGLAPSSGLTTITGQAPAITTAETPATGTISLAGQQPALTTVTKPAVGAISISGQQPTFAANTGVSPSTGAVTVAGQQPTLSTTTFVGGGYASGLLLALTTTAPNNLFPSTGAAALAGVQPYVTYAPTSALPPGSASGLLLALTASQAGANSVVNPATGSVTLAGQQMLLNGPVSLSPVNGAAAVTGQQPTVAQSAAASGTPLGLLLAFTRPPDLSVATPAAGAVTIVGQQPVITGAATTIATGTPLGLLLAVTAGGTAANNNVSPATGSVTLAGQAALVPQGISPSTGAITLVQLRPSISTSAAPSSGAIAIVGQQPVVSNGGFYFPGTGSVSLKGAKPHITGQYHLGRDRRRVRSVS